MLQFTRKGMIKAEPLSCLNNIFCLLVWGFHVFAFNEGGENGLIEFTFCKKRFCRNFPNFTRTHAVLKSLKFSFEVLDARFHCAQTNLKTTKRLWPSRWLTVQVTWESPPNSGYALKRISGNCDVWQHRPMISANDKSPTRAWLLNSWHQSTDVLATQLALLANKTFEKWSKIYFGLQQHWEMMYAWQW